MTQASSTRSRDLFARAQAALAGGVSTAFRAAEAPVPLFFARAEGARLFDVDGVEYVDYTCGFGPVILGHGHPRVAEAVARAAADLQQVGGQHEGEVELAERLRDRVPAFERVRLALTGSEAVHAALRTARAVTGRPLIVKFAGHYHGWLDAVYTGMSTELSGRPETAGQDASALEHVRVVEWNDVQALADVFDAEGADIAAVIMEPLACNGGVIHPREGYLEQVRDLVHAHGALLVFDEVITGFRVGIGGAQELFGVTPDLAVVAKALGNGFPISAFGGRADVMDVVARNEALHAGTYNGGGISVAAALATTEALLESPDTYDRMRSLGRRLMKGLERVASQHGRALTTSGPGPVFFAWFRDTPVESFADHLQSDFQTYARFSASLLGYGVRTIPNGRWYLTAAHTDGDVDETLDAADQALAELGAPSHRPQRRSQ